MSKSDFRKYHIEKLKEEAVVLKYLEIALQEFEVDGDSEVFLLALQDIAEAKVKNGIEQSAKGQTKYIGSFASHVEEEVDAP